MAATVTEHGCCRSAGSASRPARGLDVRSPYSGEVVGRVAAGGADEARRALDAAAAALARPAAGPRARAHPRRRGAAARASGTTRPRRLISAEAGKPLKAARVEAPARGLDVHVRRGRGTQARGRGRADGRLAGRRGEARVHAARCRSGSSARSRPFNFPLNLVAHKVAPALAAGCPVVLKPAAATPLSALFLAALEEEAGLPPGWLNVVAGPGVARSATCSSRTSG